MTNAKKNKKNVVALFVIFAVLIAGAFAFLTATDSKINRFEIGTADVQVLEPSWSEADENGNDVPDAAENIGSLDKLTKDPQVQNTGSINQWLYASVQIPKSTAPHYGYEDGEKVLIEDTETEVFDLLKLDSDSEYVKGVRTGTLSSEWTLIGADTSADDSVTYYYAYNSAVAPNGLTTKLFDAVQLKDFASSEYDEDTETYAGIEESTQNVIVNAYGIQSDDSASSALEAWNLYVNQNELSGTVPVYTPASPAETD